MRRSLVILALSAAFASRPGGDLRAQDVNAALSAPVPAAPPADNKKKLDDATIERLLRIQEQEEVAVRLVLVPASVEDKKGRAVTGLKAGDFQLKDERLSLIHISEPT